MKVLSALSLSTLVALTLNLSGAPAQAATPDAAPAPLAALAVPALWDAEGEYELQDGRNLSLRVRGNQPRVALESAAEERWRVQSPDLLVSPDGQRRIHLHRDRSGRVQQVTLEMRGR